MTNKVTLQCRPVIVVLSECFSLMKNKVASVSMTMDSNRRIAGVLSFHGRTSRPLA